MTDFYQSKCLEFSYRDGKVLGTQPHQTYGSTSPHCIPYPNCIKGFSNRLSYIHTHTKPTLNKHLTSILPLSNVA